MARAERKAFVNHDRGKIGIENGRAERVLEAADEDRLVDEGVQRPAQAAPFRRQGRPACGRRAGDNQDLEVRSMRFRLPQRRRQGVRRHGFVILVLVPHARILAEGPGQHGAGDPAGQGRRGLRVVGRGVIAQRGHQLRAGIGVKLFGRGHLGERRVELGAAAGIVGPRFGQFHQIRPLIATCAGAGEELVDARKRTGSLGHTNTPGLIASVSRTALISAGRRELTYSKGKRRNALVQRRTNKDFRSGAQTDHGPPRSPEKCGLAKDFIPTSMSSRCRPACRPENR